MAASRLTDGQKQELVDRYRQGETAQALAQAYGCSPNTVSRVLKAAMDPEELAALKKQPRARQSVAAAAVAAGASAAQLELPEQEQEQQLPLPRAAKAEPFVPETDIDPDPEPDAEPGLLAIDDADDFGDPAVDDGDDDDADDGAPTPAPALPRQAVSARPLHSGALPASVYLLVDKTVELEARPLREFPELGALPEEEQERQALMLFTNPRQAKRHCGRSQRVIKVPDSGVLERTSRYLVAQGITRLVLEGGDLFAVPGA